MVELCRARQKLLEPILPEARPLLEELRSGANPFTVLYSRFLTTLSKRVKSAPGREFAVAFQTAREVGCSFVFGDRPVSITLARTWAALSLSEKVRLSFSLLFGALRLPDGDELRALIESLKDSDVVTQLVKELAAEFPSLLPPLIHERDLFMAWTLQRVAERGVPSIVAVVGLGHVAGIVAAINDEVGGGGGGG